MRRICMCAELAAPARAADPPAIPFRSGTAPAHYTGTSTAYKYTSTQRATGDRPPCPYTMGHQQ